MADTVIRLGYVSVSGGGGAGFEEYPNLAGFPPTGQADVIYVALDTNKTYRWSGTIYVEISPSEVISVNTKVGVVVLDKTDIGLGNVDNTSDADKPISDATQDALDLKYDASNPAGYVDTAGAAAAAPVQSVNAQVGDVVLDKGDVGLDQVDNTSDLDKPISNDTQDALDLKVDKAGDTMTGPLNMSDLGENVQFSVYGLNSSSGIEIKSDDQTILPSGNVKLTTGNVQGSDNAGSIYLTGGSNVDGNPANIILEAGTSSGTGVNGSITLDSAQVVYLNQNPTGYIDAVNHNIQNVLDPVSPQDAATKKWVEDISAIDSTLFVSPNASLFGADGSLLRPFVNIVDALAAASDEYTIVLLPGNYNEGTVVIPSTLKFISFTSTSKSSCNVINGFSYTAPSDSIDLTFNKISVGLLTLDVSSALNGLVTIKDCSFSIDRQDTNNNVFLTVTESTFFGGTIEGGGNNFSETLQVASLIVNGGSVTYENSKFVSNTEAYGSCTIRLLDSSVFGAPEFVFGYEVSGNIPTIEIDTASDYLGSLNGDFTKILLATIPTANISTEGANTDQALIFDGASWIPSNINASIVEYAPAISGDWSPEPTLVSDALDQLAANTSGNISNLVDIHTDTKEPTGFINRTSSTTSFDDLTREFTIAPVSGDFSFYLKGVKYTKTSAETITITNSDGNHYIYFDANGDLTSTQAFSIDIIEQFAFVSVVYWNTSTSSHTYFAEERHGITMDGVSHAYLHTVFGARYLSGLALQGFSVDGNGTSNTHAQFTADSGSIRDEDLLLTSSAQTEIPILYRIGQYWRKKPADSYPLIYNDGVTYTGARIPYNQYTGGSWQLTAVDNNKFVLVHLFASNDKETPIIGIQGIAQYNDVPSARVAANSEITSLSGLPFTEFVAIGTVIFQTGTFTNTPNAIVRSTNGANYVDFRGTQLYTPAGEATEHSLLSGLADDDHLQYHTDARGDARYNLKSSGDISETSFSIANNQSGAVDITNFAFSNSIVRSFEAIVSVEIDATASLFEKLTINGIKRSSDWEISISSTGDISGIVFSITSSGQLQYTSQNYSGFVSGSIKFKAFTTSI